MTQKGRQGMLGKPGQGMMVMWAGTEMMACAKTQTYFGGVWRYVIGKDESNITARLFDETTQWTVAWQVTWPFMHTATEGQGGRSFYLWVIPKGRTFNSHWSQTAWETKPVAGSLWNEGTYISLELGHWQLTVRVWGAGERSGWETSKWKSVMNPWHLKERFLGSLRNKLHHTVEGPWW